VTSEVDLAGMMDAVQPFMYRYSGALTTPPCTPVKWFVAIATQGISTQEWAEFAVSNGLVENARPLQPLNGRTVERYELGSPISVPII
jgi:carbonic anhydrase